MRPNIRTGIQHSTSPSILGSVVRLGNSASAAYSRLKRPGHLAFGQWLLLAMLLCTLGCGGGSAVREYKNDAGEVESITFFGPEVKDSDFEVLGELGNLKELLVQECVNVSDAGFNGAKGAESVESITISHSPFSDSALDALSGLTNVREMQLIKTDVTGSGLKNLSASPLATLVIHGDTLTGEGMQSLEALQSLQNLTLMSESVSLADMPALASLSQLQNLQAERIAVGKNGCDSLKGLAALKKLSLVSEDIDDTSVAALNTLTGLEEVHLMEASITDEGLAQLNLPNVTVLDLTGCSQITDAGLSQLAGVPKVETLIILDTGVKKDLTGLGNLKNLKTVQLRKDYFFGGQEAIDALVALLPDVTVSINTD